jgi:ABC-type protease/lipase transport system fused ATPase/permease subunit
VSTRRSSISAGSCRPSGATAGPLTHTLFASLFIQLFALVTPLFFQVIIDKVLPHKGMSTLVVVVIGLLLIGLFDVVLQYLRAYALNHTASRIDVELGSPCSTTCCGCRCPTSRREPRVRPWPGCASWRRSARS